MKVHFAKCKKLLYRKVCKEQNAKNWPRLSREVMGICEAVNLPDIIVNDVCAGVVKKAPLRRTYW